MRMREVGFVSCILYSPPLTSSGLVHSALGGACIVLEERVYGREYVFGS